MATRKRDRFFALFGAILFLLTSSALVISIVVSAIQEKHQNDGAASQQSTKKETTLEGTKLTDFTPVSSVPQLQTSVLTAGNGTAAKSGDTLVVDYTGALAATGVIFQSSLDSGQTFSFKLGAGQVITGWDQGLVGAKPGEKVRLLIPSSLGYGSQAQSSIPANSDLVFDITVHSVTPGS